MLASREQILQIAEEETAKAAAVVTRTVIESINRIPEGQVAEGVREDDIRHMVRQVFGSLHWVPEEQLGS